MPVTQDVNEAINSQLGDWRPGEPEKKKPGEPPTPPPEAQKGWEFGKSIEKTGEEVGAGFLRGVRGGDELLKAGIYSVAKPLIPETGKAGEVARSIMTPVFERQKEAIEKRAAHPETFAGKILEPAAEGVGGMVTMPMPGGFWRNFIAGIGMGEGSEIGGKMLGGLFNYFGGPAGREVGETTGKILGGGVGSQANVTRMRAMGEALRQPVEAVKSVKPAYEAARSAQRAGDQRALWQIFADEFGNLRATTRGVISNFTNANVAAAIRRDIQASSMAEQFVQDAKTTGIELKPWGLGERTMVPALTRMVKERVPKTFGEASEAAGQAQARQTSIVDAYNRLQGEKLPANAEGAQASATALQKITQAKLDALSAEEGAVKNKFPDLNPQFEHAMGEKVRDVRDRMATDSLNIARGKYAEAERLFDAEGKRIDLGGVKEKAKDILGEFIAQANPAEVPPIVKSVLAATREEKELIIPGEEALSKSVPLKDANDLVRALHRMATQYRSQERFQDMNRAVQLEKEVLNSIGKTEVSPAAQAAYQEARRYWGQEHAPRFMEGMGKALSKERGGILEGREAVKSEDVMQKFLRDKETGMQEFERIYGNDSEARTVLRQSLEGNFRDKVLNRARNPDALDRATYEFKKDFGSALERFPEVADKIDQQSAKMYSLMKEKERELDRYKFLMGPKAEVTDKIGPIQAKILYQNVLADPVKMDALLKRIPISQHDVAKNMVKEVFLQANPMKNGNYDPEALYALLRAGKENPAAKSSMEKLFSAAFGAKEGRRHLDVLEAIANFTMREAATNPVNLRPGSLISDQPVKEATGQSLASWIAAWRAQEVRATGSAFFATLGLSRFANAKVQQAVEAAKMKALYDPETADAILELASKPATEPIAKTSAMKIWGAMRLPSGKKIVDHLIDKGYVKDYVSRGLIYGAESAAQDEQDPNKVAYYRR